MCAYAVTPHLHLAVLRATLGCGGTIRLLLSEMRFLLMVPASFSACVAPLSNWAGNQKVLLAI